MKYLNAYRDSLAYAKEEGSLRQAQSMAKRMLAKNYPLEEIEALTGLSSPEILSLNQSP
jgi:hypothetical protein